MEKPKKKQIQKYDLFDETMILQYEVIENMVFAIGDTISYLIKTILSIALRERKIRIIILREKNKRNQKELDLQIR